MRTLRKLLALPVWVAVMAGCAYVPPQQTFDSPPPGGVRVGPQIVLSDQPYRRGPAVQRFIGYPYESLAEAQAHLSFTLWTPAVLPPQFERVWIGVVHRNALRLTYSDGEHYLHIVEEARESAPAPLSAEAMAELHLHPLTVNGHAGYGRDRGALPIPLPGGVFISPTPPHLEWSVERVQFTLSPEDAALTLADLTAIAESMQPLQAK